ncbi:hypothetical protein [Stenotrophomonas maltophilia]
MVKVLLFSAVLFGAVAVLKDELYFAVVSALLGLLAYGFQAAEDRSNGR